jgi:hypothetical protein
MCWGKGIVHRHGAWEPAGSGCSLGEDVLRIFGKIVVLMERVSFGLFCFRHLGVGDQANGDREGDGNWAIEIHAIGQGL